MRLYLFRHRDEIPMDTLKLMAERTTKVLGIETIVFEEPLNMDVKEADMGRLLKISDSFLERGEPIVAVVFTNESGMHEGILGEGSERSRGVWVRASGDLNKTFLSCLHELCHVFEADHCARRECLMYPFYTPRPMEGMALESLMCGSCLQTIRESWVYNRLVSSSKARNSEGKLLPKVISSSSMRRSDSVAGSAISQKELPQTRNNRAFPDWSLPREELIRKVKEFFGYED